MGETCPAPAKLNLFLRVLGRRADGYHSLQTLFRFLNYGDALRFAVREDGAIVRANSIPGLPPENDLCVRAARLLQRESGVALGAEITLDKRLPLGGGLGGGSSDAATTLLALNRLWGVHFPRERLQRLALQLGADVPAFVFGESAFAEGVGEKLQAVSLPPAWYLVLVPQVHVSTAQVFADPALTRDSIPIRIADFSGALGHNDLAPVVCSRHPEVARHLAWLERFGNAAMTGSGACVFAAFDTEQQARRACAQLPQDMQGFVAQGLDRHPLRDWAD